MKKFPVIGLLDNIRSAYNVGAMFRTADGAGIQKLYLTGITPHPPHAKIPKTSLGALDNVDWEYAENTLDIVKILKEQGMKIISIEKNSSSVDYKSFKFEPNSLLIFGNEIKGVSKEVLELSDAVVHLPMYGMKESLNVATTFGVIMYEAISQLK